MTPSVDTVTSQEASACFRYYAGEILQEFEPLPPLPPLIEVVLKDPTHRRGQCMVRCDCGHVVHVVVVTDPNGTVVQHAWGPFEDTP